MAAALAATAQKIRLKPKPFFHYAPFLIFIAIIAAVVGLWYWFEGGWDRGLFRLCRAACVRISMPIKRMPGSVSILKRKCLMCAQKVSFMAVLCPGPRTFLLAMRPLIQRSAHSTRPSPCWSIALVVFAVEKPSLA